MQSLNQNSKLQNTAVLRQPDVCQLIGEAQKRSTSLAIKYFLEAE
jgi:hypothetical protein